LAKSVPQSNQAVRHCVPCATPSHESSNALRLQILIDRTPMMSPPQNAQADIVTAKLNFQKPIQGWLALYKWIGQR
jgi:hypothetical protein